MLVVLFAAWWLYSVLVVLFQSRPNCLLPELLEWLAVPRALQNPKKALPPELVAALREHLHQFVQGFQHLNHRTDPYLQRKLRLVVQQHLHRFPLLSSGSEAAVHPLLAVLQDSCGWRPGPASRDLRVHMLQLLSTELAVTSSDPAPTRHVTLSLLAHLLDTTLETEQVARSDTTSSALSTKHFLNQEIGRVPQP